MLHGTDPAAVRDADHERQSDATARPVAVLRDMADDLVQRGVGEAVELHLHDGAQAVQRHAERGTGDAGLRDRRVEAAVGAHLGLQSVGDAEHTAELADILAVDDHGVVRAHRVAQRGVERAGHRQLHQAGSSAAVNS